MATARKFMLQIAQLSYLNQEMNAENASVLKKAAAASQESAASSAKLAESMRQLSDHLAAQLRSSPRGSTRDPEPDHQHQVMLRRGALSVAVLSLLAGFSLASAPAWADAEWDAAGGPTRERIAEVRAALPADGPGSWPRRPSRPAPTAARSTS